MRAGAAIVFLVGLACRGGPPNAAAAGADGQNPSPLPPTSAQPRQSSAPTQTSAGAPSKSAAYYEISELRALAAQVKSVKKDRLLVCGEANGRNCVCVEPLACEGNGDCVDYSQNVDAFRAALTSKTPGRSVECRRAEIGRCGEFRYFYFEGDIARRQMRWFDGAGKLVAERNSSDYEQYCGGKSRTSFQGKIPRCPAIQRTELICGSAEGDLPLPIEDVLKRRLPAKNGGKP